MEQVEQRGDISVTGIEVSNLSLFVEIARAQESLFYV
jgi:hypothetical protein